MSLNIEQIKIVRTEVEKIAGRGAKVRVFGSRLNDSRRSGDLDLLVESDAPLDAISRADLKLNMGKIFRNLIKTFAAALKNPECFFLIANENFRQRLFFH